MSSPNQQIRFSAQLVTYRLTPNAPIEQGFRRGRIFNNLSKEPGFQELFWGRWAEDEYCIDILITWRGDVDTERTLQHLSPLNSYLRPGCVPILMNLDSSLERLHVPRDGGAHVSITSFRIPASVYAADSGIKDRIIDVFHALALGAPRHGSGYIPPPEEEIPLARRIGTATSSWDSAWVDSQSPKEEDGNTTVDKNWVACIQWERSQFETEFKTRRDRHFNIRVHRLNDVRGLDSQDSTADAGREEGNDPAAATAGFWRPITETWDAQFEEHHVVFYRIDKYNSMAGGGSWSSCIIQ